MALNQIVDKNKNVFLNGCGQAKGLAPRTRDYEGMENGSVTIDVKKRDGELDRVVPNGL